MSKRLLLLALLAGCATPTTSAGVARDGEDPITTSVEADPAPTPVWTPRVNRTVPASRSRQARRSHVGSGSHLLNWHALAKCESTNNPRAISSSGAYRGLYQFDLQTWRSVGGSGDPAAASPTEQTHRAWLLYKARGRSPWPICGRHL